MDLARLFLIACLSWVGGGGGAGETASGTLIVLNKAESTASLVDLAHGREVAKIPTGNGPHEVAVSPDGRLAVVADYGDQRPGSTLTILDLEKRIAARKVDLAPHQRPHGIVWLGEEMRVAVTSETSKALLIVDLEAGKVEKAIATGQDVSHMVALTPDQRFAITSNIGSGSATIIDLAEERAIANVKTGAGAEGIDVSPDGAFVWVGNRAADTVSVVDVKTQAVVATLPCKGFPIRVKLTPNGKHALVSCAKSGELALFDAATHEELKRFKTTLAAPGGDASTLGGEFATSATPIGILIHPDGKRAWVAHANADAIAVIDCERWEPVGSLSAGKGPDGLAWSPLQAKEPAPAR